MSTPLVSIAVDVEILEVRGLTRMWARPCIMDPNILALFKVNKGKIPKLKI